MENSSLSLGSIISSIKGHKWLFVIVMSIALVLSVIVAWGTPKLYESSSSLAVESKESSPIGGNMSSLASLAGVNLSKSNDAIVPDLYPNVVETNDFLVGLLSSHVRPKGMKRDITYIDYLQHYQKSSWTMQALKAVASLVMKEKPKKVVKAKDINPEELTKEQDALVEGTKGRILCTVDKENNIINVKAYAQDAYVAKQLAETVGKQLQTFMTDYRTNKSRVDLAYYEKLKKEAYARYVRAQRKYAVYSDSHTDLTLKSYQLESDALENDLQLAYNNYSQACTQVVMAEAKVQERTPVFTVLEKPSVSIMAVSPKKKLIVLAFMFVSFFATACYVLIKDQYTNARNEKVAVQTQQTAELEQKAEA